MFQSNAGTGITSDSQWLIDNILALHPESCLRVLELGSGDGIGAVYAALARPSWNIHGVEIRSHCVENARYNAAVTEVNIAFETADFMKIQFHSSFDIVFANPPFFRLGEGRVPPTGDRAIERFEVACDMPGVLTAMHNALSHDGAGYIIYPPAREQEMRKTAPLCGLNASLIERQTHPDGRVRLQMWQLQRV